MISKTLLKRLFVYNMHIGHYGAYNSNLNNYVLGRRLNYVILDLNSTLILLKKALLFLKVLASRNGYLLFFYSKYTYLNLMFKCVLLSITTKCTQPIITNK